MCRSDVRVLQSSEETIKHSFHLIFTWEKDLLAFKFINIIRSGLLQFLRVKLKLHCWFLLKRFSPESFLLLLVSSWSCSTGNMVAPPNDQLRFNQLFQRRISYQRKVIKADQLLQPAESRIFTMGHSGNELLALQHLLFRLSSSSKCYSDHDRQR